ncbi:MAG: glycosyltransferase family 1 protein [Lachnospiraceae bacterium]|nr:glycosyltransferase family 1 protein [Lachnospiraceae bacterium]
MIRVLQVVGKMHYGGMETLIMNLYRNIDRSKVQFDFLVHYEEPGEYDEEIRRLGGRIYVMPKTTFRNYLIYKKALEQFFKNHPEYKVIHGHLQSVAFMYHKIAKKYGDRYCITHAHNNGVEHSLKGRVSYFTALLAQRHTDEFWGCSMEACRYFFPRAMKQHKEVKIIRNGIEAEKYQFREEVRQKVRKELGLSDRFVIGHVGRFSEQKNQSFLIDILEELKKKKEDAVLVLVGKGPDEKKILEKVKQKGLLGQVFFLGAREDVNEVMMAMDAFVLPSLFEGFGIVLVEAQSVGLPCFCTKGKIPSITRISTSYYPISLMESAGFWADSILKHCASEERTDWQERYRLAIEQGFDIREIAKDVESEYIDFAKKLDGEQK